jgi:hypothetical protein
MAQARDFSAIVFCRRRTRRRRIGATPQPGLRETRFPMESRRIGGFDKSGI